MKAQIKESNFLENTSGDLNIVKKVDTKRPNIDHLIKRILVERRKEQKKNLLITIIVVLTIVVTMGLSFN